MLHIKRFIVKLHLQIFEYANELICIIIMRDKFLFSMEC